MPKPVLLDQMAFLSQQIILAYSQKQACLLDAWLFGLYFWTWLTWISPTPMPADLGRLSSTCDIVFSACINLPSLLIPVAAGLSGTQPALVLGSMFIVVLSYCHLLWGAPWCLYLNKINITVYVGMSYHLVFIIARDTSSLVLLP
jgi:hypothetical protein